jgi:hypothetical protein
MKGNITIHVFSDVEIMLNGRKYNNIVPNIKHFHPKANIIGYDIHYISEHFSEWVQLKLHDWTALNF